MARLVTPPALEGVWEVCLSIFNIGATNPQRHAQNNNTVTTENLEKSIEKAVQKALPREEPHGRPSPREAVPAPQGRAAPLPSQPPSSHRSPPATA
ncbi:hypothetical protein E4U14_004211 [Claviceps sp. LM454 group G7]|nr:hypothetical protein E4U14_004211 [Claviceps sp. LM454 group G7]